MRNEKTLFALLSKDYYIGYYKGKMIVTNKFYRAFEHPVINYYEEEPEEPQAFSAISKKETTAKNEVKTGNEISEENLDFLKFLEEVIKPPVKFRRTNKLGIEYSVYRYTKKADIEYRKAILNGANRSILLASARFYYRRETYAVSTSRYFEDGIWLGEYTQYMNNVQNRQDEHI